MSNNLLERVRAHEELSLYICDCCEENGIAVSFDDKVLTNSYLIIKPDSYYNSAVFGAQRPPSPDCFIIQMCEEEQYKLTIVELKDIQHAKDISAENIRQKFRTCFEDFIPHRFPNLLEIEYKSIHLYFVSNIDVFRKQNLGLTIETLMDTRFLYKHRKYMLRFSLPNPTITKCY